MQILLDADVIRHFIDGSQQFNLSKIFPKQLSIVDKVKEELIVSKKYKDTVLSFIDMCKIKEIELESFPNSILEYAKLKKTMGVGEAACLAIAKNNDKIIASSNIRDIKNYCESNNIKFYTTLDILLIAIKNQVLTPEECNEFIEVVKSKGNKLPSWTIEEYAERKQGFSN